MVEVAHPLQRLTRQDGIQDGHQKGCLNISGTIREVEQIFWCLWYGFQVKGIQKTYLQYRLKITWPCQVEVSWQSWSNIVNLPYLVNSRRYDHYSDVYYRVLKKKESLQIYFIFCLKITWPWKSRSLDKVGWGKRPTISKWKMMMIQLLGSGPRSLLLLTPLHRHYSNCLFIFHILICFFQFSSFCVLFKWYN